MKITYFRLKGYVRLLNGMGVDEIVIPFKEFKNRIVLVSGVNGTGKSTIISALSPNPDSNDSFGTDLIIDQYGNRQIIEYPGEKEIWYEETDENGNVNEYKILIQSLVDESKTHRTTKAFISKNGEEFNPNGNVSSFKEVRDSLLGIDQIYLDLSSITAENRGIVDMIPSERRKYMASYIGSLDTYNNIFKVISKKVSNLKSYMNTLNSKIYEIGDENELRLRQMQLEDKQTSLSNARDALIKELGEAESIVKVVDPDNKMQDLYVSISDELKTIDLQMEKDQSKRDKICAALMIDPQNTDFVALRDSTSSEIEANKREYEANKTKIGTLITLQNATMDTLNSDKATLERLSCDLTHGDIEQVVSDLRKEIENLKMYLDESKMAILSSTSEDELRDLKSACESFVSSITNLEELGTEESFIKAVSLCANSFKETKVVNTLSNLRKTVSSQKEELAAKRSELSRIEEDLSVLKEFTDMRPKECTIDTCPYISQYIQKQANAKTQDDYDILSKEITIIESYIEEAEKSISFDETVISILNKLNPVVSVILSMKNSFSKIPELSNFVDLEELKKCMTRHYRFPEILVISDLISDHSVYSDLVKKEDRLKDLEAELRIYSNNKTMIESLTTSIEKNQKAYDDQTTEIGKLTNECNFLDGLVSTLSAKLVTLNELVDVQTGIDNCITRKGQLRDEFNAVKDKIKLVKEKVDLVTSKKTEISLIDRDLSVVNESITQIKINLTNIVAYQQEYKDCSDKYDKMVFIRNACSPGNGLGIQSEYIKRYMNDIVIECNKMLSYMFGGLIQLDVPVINEKQFSVPFIGPNGIPVPDISNGSTAQKCMIGLVFSCVAMMKSSTKYNIPRFDEIDGGLDPANRLTFITVLNQVLDFMNAEQCVICSHNIEFDNYSTSKIICTPQGVALEA